MATVSESLTFAVVESALKAYLGVSGTDEDASLRLWLASATDAADRFLNNDFEDDAGADLPIPDAVTLGVFEWIRLARQTMGTSGLPIGAVAVQSVKTGDLAQTYTTINPNAGGSASLEGLLDAVKQHWRNYRTDIFI